MIVWTEENHRLCAETYCAIGKAWTDRTPNFALDDFVKLNPNLWHRICEAETKIDHPNVTAPGVEYGLNNLYNLWMDMFDAAEKENKKFLKRGFPVEPSEVTGMQWYRDEDDLKRHTFVKMDGCSLFSILDFFGRTKTLVEVVEERNPRPPVVYGIWVCDDGTVRASKGKRVESPGLESRPEPRSESQKVAWETVATKSPETKVDDFDETDIEIAGYQTKPKVIEQQIEEIEPLVPGASHEFDLPDDFEIREVFEG